MRLLRAFHVIYFLLFSVTARHVMAYIIDAGLHVIIIRFIKPPLSSRPLISFRHALCLFSPATLSHMLHRYTYIYITIFLYMSFLRYYCLRRRRMTWETPCHCFRHITTRRLLLLSLIFSHYAWYRYIYYTPLFSAAARFPVTLFILYDMSLKATLICCLLFEVYACAILLYLLHYAIAATYIVLYLYHNTARRFFFSARHWHATMDIRRDTLLHIYAWYAAAIRHLYFHYTYIDCKRFNTYITMTHALERGNAAAATTAFHYGFLPPALKRVHVITFSESVCWLPLPSSFVFHYHAIIIVFRYDVTRCAQNIERFAVAIIIFQHTLLMIEALFHCFLLLLHYTLCYIMRHATSRHDGRHIHYWCATYAIFSTWGCRATYLFDDIIITPLDIAIILWHTWHIVFDTFCLIYDISPVRYIFIIITYIIRHTHILYMSYAATPHIERYAAATRFMSWITALFIAIALRHGMPRRIRTLFHTRIRHYLLLKSLLPYYWWCFLHARYVARHAIELRHYERIRSLVPWLGERH